MQAKYLLHLLQINGSKRYTPSLTRLLNLHVTESTPHQPALKKKKQSPFMELKNGVKNYVAILGVVSVLLTGSIGLLKLDAQWLAVKEAAIPLCIGIGVLVANFLGFPLIRKLLYNPSVMRVDRVDEVLQARGNQQQFLQRLDRANILFACTFFFSAVANYVLAKMIVKSASGTEAFNNELGRMTLLSYPVIAIPSMIMMLAIFYYIWRTISKLTDLKLEQVIVGGEEEEK